MYGAVAAVCKFVYFAMSFADHAAKFKALAETAHAAEKNPKRLKVRSFVVVLSVQAVDLKQAHCHNADTTAKHNSDNKKRAVRSYIRLLSAHKNIAIRVELRRAD